MDETDGDSAGASWPGTFADDAASGPAVRGVTQPPRRRTTPAAIFSLYILAVAGIAAAVVVACLPAPDAARYGRASPQAHDAVAAARQVARSIEPEWTAEQYRGHVERQYAAAGVFLESDEAVELSELTGCLELAFINYRQVGDYLEQRQLSGNGSYGRAEIRRRWEDAARLVECAELLLDPKTTEQGLQALEEFLGERGGPSEEDAE